jgi:dTDP-4-dehydrorhamnose 3,5-epimerase
MSFKETPIADLLIYTPRVFEDERGYFFESYNQNVFKKAGLNYQFVQDNQSFSTFGTVRGIHMQSGEHAQTKLVRVSEGKVLDVAVDLRPGSKTFGKWFSAELSAENAQQLLVPRGFGHGFCVLSERAVFQYKVDNFYNKESEVGILYNDKTLNVNWGLPEEKILVSAKDKLLGSFQDFAREM